MARGIFQGGKKSQRKPSCCEKRRIKRAKKDAEVFSRTNGHSSEGEGGGDSGCRARGGYRMAARKKLGGRRKEDIDGSRFGTRKTRSCRERTEERVKQSIGGEGSGRSKAGWEGTSSPLFRRKWREKRRETESFAISAWEKSVSFSEKQRKEKIG